MPDIVDELRKSATQARAIDRSSLLLAAADEIERLQLTHPTKEEIVACMLTTDGHVLNKSGQETLRNFIKRVGRAVS